jgi:hypothetical protein
VKQRTLPPPGAAAASPPAYLPGIASLFAKKDGLTAATLTRRTCLFYEKVTILPAHSARLPLISFPL